MYNKFLVLFILGLTTGLLQAEVYEQAGTNSYDFLSIGTGARPLSMGGAYTAESGNIYSLYWNPAGIGDIKRTTLMLDYMKYVLNDMHKGMLAFVLDKEKINEVGIVGGYINYFTAGEFEYVDESGQADPSRDFRAGYSEFCATFAKQIPQLKKYQVTLGATAKGLLESIADYRSKGMGVDLGVHLAIPARRIKIGGAIKNLGKVFYHNDSDFPLPQIYSLGLMYYTKAVQQTIFMVDWNKPRYGYYTLRLGIEFRVNREFYIRGGYRFLQNELEHWYRVATGSDEEYVREDINSWSAGVGFKIARMLLLDVAVNKTSFQAMPLIQVSLLYSFK
jgi:hypothetical protein